MQIATILDLGSNKALKRVSGPFGVSMITHAEN